MKKLSSVWKLAIPLTIVITSPLSVVVSCSEHSFNEFNGMSINQYFLKKPVFSASELGLDANVEQARWIIDNEWIVAHFDTIFIRNRVVANFRYIASLNVEIHQSMGLQVGINFINRDGRIGPLLQFKIIDFKARFLSDF